VKGQYLAKIWTSVRWHLFLDRSAEAITDLTPLLRLPGNAATWRKGDLQVWITRAGGFLLWTAEF